MLVLAIILFGFLFYFEEDWRGAHAWAVTKARWEAKGLTLDLRKIAPPAIPESENLAAIPLFHLDANGPNAGEPTALETAMRKDMPGGDIPYISMSAPLEGMPDVSKIKLAVADEYKAAFPKMPVPASASEELDALFPFLSDLLTASAAWPLCRLPADYSKWPPSSRPLGGITVHIKLTRLLTLQAILALDDHQPALALEDIETIYKLLSGVQRDPTLVAGLVAIGMAAISNEAVEYGLADHAWSDRQLMEFQKTLGSVDFLASYQAALQGEACYFIGNMECFWRSQERAPLRSMIQQVSSPQLPLLTRFAPPWPSGWWKENISLEANFLFNQLAIIDHRQRRVYPEKSLQLRHAEEQEVKRWDAKGPWRIFFTTASSPLQCTSKFAFAQAHLDEARIACALEHYRLAHGAYPTTLNELAPTIVSGLPNDPINGNPYRYLSRPNGTYLLYSPGWDLKDDGGTVVYRTDEPRAINETKGDWVWPTPK